MNALNELRQSYRDDGLLRSILLFLFKFLIFIKRLIKKPRQLSDDMDLSSLHSTYQKKRNIRSAYSCLLAAETLKLDNISFLRAASECIELFHLKAEFNNKLDQFDQCIDDISNSITHAMDIIIEIKKMQNSQNVFMTIGSNDYLYSRNHNTDILGSYTMPVSLSNNSSDCNGNNKYNKDLNLKTVNIMQQRVSDQNVDHVIDLTRPQINYLITKLDKVIDSTEVNLVRVISLNREIYNEKSEVVRMHSARILKYKSIEKIVELLNKKRFEVGLELSRLYKKQKRINFFVGSNEAEKLEQDLKIKRDHILKELKILKEEKIPLLDVYNDMLDLERLYNRKNYIISFLVDFEKRWLYKDDLPRRLLDNSKQQASSYLKRLRMKFRKELKIVNFSIKILKEKFEIIGIDLDTSFVMYFVKFYEGLKLLEDYGCDDMFFQKQAVEITETISKLENKKLGIRIRIYNLKTKSNILKKMMRLDLERLVLMRNVSRYQEKTINLFQSEINKIKADRSAIY